ncbi:MAG: class I SAM-dependent methyltransferase [Proteobacteria bacterium]|nr:class I SAM-dependent methyltransferase [Pseudomonadota bacterium]
MRSPMNKTLVLLSAVFLAACQPAEKSAETDAVDAADSMQDRIAAALDAQPDEVKARYQYRHPRETLEFFGIEPGMTIVEGLPGRGWYTKVLLPYLGGNGHLIGADYSLEMYPLFSFANEEFLAEQNAWLTDWPVEAEGWRGDDGATIDAFHFGSMPDDIVGTADAVFLVRVLHNLARFENAGQGDFLTTALAESYAALKPGGIFGVVQHHARDDMPDDWADGSKGYLKKQFVIEQIEQAGFEFVAESDMNANDNDQPGTDDFVWRLPPTFATSRDDPDLKAQYEAVGESNRMTLKFRKPEQDESGG